MPWTVKDVDSKKKGLTPAQKKKWVKIANSVLKDCQAKGDKNCEAKAIKVANSKFTELQDGKVSDIIHQDDKKSKQSEVNSMEDKLPKGALRFVDQGCHAVLEFAEMEDDEGKKKRVPKLKMVGYSGGIIKDHWYWDNLAIDLQGIKFSQKKYPVLEDHRTDRKIAVMGKPTIENGQLEASENAKFLRTEAADEFIKLSEDGFPYQSSIYAKPSVVERVDEGSSVEVNGFKLKGPGAVWRECEFKEMSVCVFGWDSKTQASAFSKDEFETVSFTEKSVSQETYLEDTDVKLIKRNKKKEVKKLMDLDQLKEEHPDLYAKVLEEGKSAALAETKGNDNEVLAEIKKVNDRIDRMEDGMTKLNESDTLRSAKELSRQADKLWNDRLSKSDLIPARLHSEIKTTVNHNKFIGEDGKFDTEAFTEAVEGKISLWEDNLKPEDDVMGSGFSEQDLDGNKAEEVQEENNKMVQRLRKMAGDTNLKKEDE